jgi:hypothetical protein
VAIVSLAAVITIDIVRMIDRDSPQPRCDA